MKKILFFIFCLSIVLIPLITGAFDKEKHDDTYVSPKNQYPTNKYNYSTWFKGENIDEAFSFKVKDWYGQGNRGIASKKELSPKPNWENQDRDPASDGNEDLYKKKDEDKLKMWKFDPNQPEEKPEIE